MARDRGRAIISTKRFLLVLTLLACAAFLPRLGTRELWPPDEPRFALIAHEMLRDGSFIVPHLQGEVYSEKPPLQVWLIALASLPFGEVTEWSARIPSALAAIATVVLTGWFARRYFGSGAGYAAALILLTSGHFFMRARWSCTDTLLTFFFLAAVVLAFLWTEGVKWAGWVFFLACALATLTKGPVGLVLPAGILVAHLVLEKRWRQIFRFPWLTGMAAFLVIVVPWYILYSMSVSAGEVGRLVLTQNISRFFSAWNNVQPFYYYLHRFPVSFLPWSIFFPVAAVAFLRARREPELAPLRYVVLWLSLVFVFFSISSGKRTVYLLPIFPAAAMVLGWFFTRGLARVGGARSRAVLASSFVFCAVLVAAAIAAPVVIVGFHREALPAALMASLLLAVGALGFAGLWWKGRLGDAFRWGGGALIVTGIVAVCWIAPLFDGFQNVRNLAPRVAALVPPGAKFATIKQKREAFLFYSRLTGEEILTDDDLRRILRGPAPAYCLVGEADWSRVGGAGDVPGSVLLRGPVSRNTFVLVWNEVSHDR